MRKLTLIALCAALAVQPSRACCPAFPPGPDTTVKIADQEIVVVWNPTTRTEHFIRRASFDSRVKGFGFLVPTPTEPALGEVNAKLFDDLRGEIEPRIVYKTQYRPQLGALVLLPFLAMRQGFAPAAGAARGLDMVTAKAFEPPVEVLQQVRVAGFDAAVLKASDATALAAWLEANGYDARPALREWVTPYVAAKWIVTAFKFAADAGEVSTGALRMSFETDRPLFPYRVPTDQLAPAGKGNTLRVFFVGPGRASGALGEAKAPWAGQVKYASNAPRIPVNLLLGDAVPLVDNVSGAWLTAFEDGTWPSGTEDLWFSTDAAGAELIPTREVVREEPVMIPADVLLGLGVGAIVFIRRRRRAAG
jgi:hypothetical protein